MRNFGSFIPVKYGDDGEITREYIEWQEWEENKDTYYEEQWEAKRDADVPTPCECEVKE